MMIFIIISVLSQNLSGTLVISQNKVKLAPAVDCVDVTVPHGTKFKVYYIGTQSIVKSPI